MMTGFMGAVRRVLGGIRALFHVLYHTPHGC